MAETWSLLRTGLRSAAENMAIDEVLLQSAAGRGVPVLRFYGWREPAASFGYFQRYADVERMTALRPLVRRPTGGGLVPHDADWTYSLVFPPAHQWYALKAIESYERLHDWVKKALIACGIAADLAQMARKTIPGQCFAGPEQFDVVWEGRKLAGAAQRRTRQGLLIQGSLQPPNQDSRDEWENAMCKTATMEWGVRWEDIDLTPELQQHVKRLIGAKYALREYNERRHGQ
jgi:lipoyl(octanoyl) transferase